MKYLVLCIGNPEGGDDAIGHYIAKRIENQQSDIYVIDCGTVPENFTSEIKKYLPNYVLLVDAVDMGLKPGEIRIIPKEKIGKMNICTHCIPLSIIIEYLKRYVERVILIGIQPQTMQGQITELVKEGAEHLISLLKHGHIDQIQSV